MFLYTQYQYMVIVSFNIRHRFFYLNLSKSGIYFIHVNCRIIQIFMFKCKTSHRFEIHVFMTIKTVNRYLPKNCFHLITITTKSIYFIKFSFQSSCLCRLIIYLQCFFTLFESMSFLEHCFGSLFGTEWQEYS